MFEPPFRIKNMMPGMIMLWKGTIATIPSGWHICDGTMNTPDLRSKFVIGPVSDVHPFYKPGETGGTTSHDHDFVGDGHAHDIAVGNVIIDSDPAGDYAHATDPAPASGTTDAKTHLPPYHVLCYIMKL